MEVQVREEAETQAKIPVCGIKDIRGEQRGGGTLLDVTMKIDTDTKEEDRDGGQVETEEERKRRSDQFKLKTRRQSKGITYFNRLRPNIHITVGSLEDWHIERGNIKRRKLNKECLQNLTMDDMQSNDQEQMIDLEQTRLNKTMLHEDWLKDFEASKAKQLRQQRQNNKKRKRSERSRSPTPKRSRTNSVISKSAKSQKSCVSDIDNESEEERKEAEKLKQEIYEYIKKKEDPQTILQISYNTKYSKKYCEEAVTELAKEGKIQQKEIAKNNTVFYVHFEQSFEKPLELDFLKLKLEEIIDIEKQESKIEREIIEVEKELKQMKLVPTTADLQKEIETLQHTLDGIQVEIDQIKQRPDFLGEDAYKETERAIDQLNKLKETYLRRKQGCIDMLDYLSDQFNMEFEQLIDKIGLDPEQMANDDEVMKILDLYQEKKKEEDDESSEEEEDKPSRQRQSTKKRTNTKAIEDMLDLEIEDDNEIHEEETDTAQSSGQKITKQIDMEEESEEAQVRFSNEDF